MKLSHRCIVTRMRLDISQRELGRRIRSSQSQVAEFEDGVYHRLSSNSTELLTGLLLEFDYNDLEWHEMATLKMRTNKLTIAKLSRRLNLPSTQISLVLRGAGTAKVSPARIRLIRRYIDTLALAHA